MHRWQCIQIANSRTRWHSTFFHESVSPRSLSTPLGPFRIFSKIRGDLSSVSRENFLAMHFFHILLRAYLCPLYTCRLNFSLFLIFRNRQAGIVSTVLLPVSHRRKIYQRCRQINFRLCKMFNVQYTVYCYTVIATGKQIPSFPCLSSNPPPPKKKMKQGDTVTNKENEKIKK